MILFKAVFAILIIIHDVSSMYENDWIVHKTKYNLTFKTSDEELNNLANFIQNKRLINNHNNVHTDSGASFRLKENSRIHYSANEFKEKFLLKFNATHRVFNHSSHRPEVLRKKFVKNPACNEEINDEYFNWVDRGVVGDVHDQRDCGSCYAFTTSNAIGSAFSIKTNKFVELSKQQIIDCTIDEEYGNFGCGGGYLETSFLYAEKVGLIRDSLYPYTNNVSKCKVNVKSEENTNRYKIESFNQTDYFAVEQMKNVIRTRGPAVAYIAASNWNFLMYGSGVYNDQTCSERFDIDHVVLVVGYGTDSVTKLPYWLVKNTWGTDWGENGYVRIARNLNICGIETVFFYPIV